MNRTQKLDIPLLTFGVLSMAKYTTDFKLSVIARYQSNHSYKRTAQHFNLDHKTVELWVKLYQTHGIESIKRRHTKAIYDTDFKLSAVLELINGKPLRQLAIELNISNLALLSNWLKSYQSFGIMGFTPKPKGRKAVSKSNKKNNKTNTDIKSTNKTKPSWQSKQDHEKSVDDLLDELAYLRAENDYLKKLDALIRKKKQSKNKL